MDGSYGDYPMKSMDPIRTSMIVIHECYRVSRLRSCMTFVYVLDAIHGHG